MFRKTKIVCTLGPATADEKIIKEMCLAGMNVARLNFSHNTHADHLERIKTVKKVREELNMPIALMLDTKGPEYRIKTFKDGKIFLNQGDKFFFTTEEIEGDQKGVSVNYKGLNEELKKGDIILLNNGLLSFEVENIDGNKIYTTVKTGGELSNRKSMSFPNISLKQVYLSEQDKTDILFGIKEDIDFIACSFVSCRQDVLDIKRFLKENGGDNIDIIAKIENRAGVENIEEICRECDGIMIARGDMGVEIPFEELPAIQKELITKCRLLGKRVIIATEMLESMINNPRPTRAEISDVANAVYDGTSAVMLSGETAMGKYPVESVKAMALISGHTEKNINYSKRFLKGDFKIKNTADAISHATCGMAIDIKAKAIVACTLSGTTARMISRFRPPVNIVGITTSLKNWRKLSLSWGVIPTLSENFDSIDVLFYNALKITKAVMNLKKGDKIVLSAGIIKGKSGNTNLIKVDNI